jgi:hypothetical protein
VTRPTSPDPRALKRYDRLVLGEQRVAALAAEWNAYWASPEGLSEKAELEAAEVAEKSRLEALRPAYIRRVLEAAGVPGRALEVAMSGDLHPTAALAAVAGSAHSLILSGGPGCGKTVAAAERIRQHVADPESWGAAGEPREPRFTGAAPVWTSAAQLARADRYRGDAVGRFTAAPLLVIDDLGVEYVDAKGFFASLLDELIDARYAAMLPTLMTTNLDAPTFRGRYGERIADRIRECGRFVGCGSASLRGREWACRAAAPGRQQTLPEAVDQVPRPDAGPTEDHRGGR